MKPNEIKAAVRTCAGKSFQEKEEWFRRVFEHAPMGIAITDMQGNFETCNPAYSAMLGYTEDEFHTLKFSDLVHPEDRAANMGELGKLKSGASQEFVIENRYVRKDGNPVSVRKYVSVLPDKSGEPAHMMALVSDMTERKAHEAALKSSKHLLELALAGAELGTWDTDMASGRSDYDERYCGMLGYQVDEIEPSMNAWLNLVHPEDRESVNDAVQAHISGKTHIFEIEHRLRHKAGHWVWVLARGKITYDANGQPVRATGTHLDITDRKRVTTEGTDLLRKIETLIASLDPRARADMRTRAANGPPINQARLSARNREVLGLLAEGLTSAETAVRLGISSETVMTHRRNLMRKLGLRNKAELIRYALQHGIGVA